MVIAWGSEPNSRLEEIARTVIGTPFTRRTWSEPPRRLAGALLDEVIDEPEPVDLRLRA